MKKAPADSQNLYAPKADFGGIKSHLFVSWVTLLASLRAADFSTDFHLEDPFQPV